MQIGAVAEQTGLSLRTIRYYEEVDLVAPSARTAGGFRLYTDEDVARLLLIKRMKPLGFSLEEMRQLLATRDELTVQDDPDERIQLLDRLAAFHEVALGRVADARTQLEHAEGFAQDLSAEIARQRAYAHDG